EIERPNRAEEHLGDALHLFFNHALHHGSRRQHDDQEHQHDKAYRNTQRGEAALERGVLDVARDGIAPRQAHCFHTDRTHDLPQLLLRYSQLRLSHFHLDGEQQGFLDETWKLTTRRTVGLVSNIALLLAGLTLTRFEDVCSDVEKAEQLAPLDAF